MANSVLRGALRLWLVTSSLAFVGASCVIEERPYREDCERYCDLLDEKCEATEVQQYERRQTCMAVCNVMQTGYGLINGDEGNTLRRRVEQLEQDDFERGECRNVGPGGVDHETDCEALCALRDAACGAVTPSDFGIGDRDQCMRGCRVLQDSSVSGAEANEAGDTLQCRLVHASEAAIGGSYAREHCSHSQILPLSPRNPCSDPVTQPKQEDCGVYCSIVMATCTEEFQVYRDDLECRTVCMLLEQGVLDDTTQNTVRCRRYHAYNAVIDPEEHCTHAGPTGDGHCGSDNCEAHCQILKAACPAQFAATHPGAPPDDLAACEALCRTLPDVGQDQFWEQAPRYGVNQELPPGTLRCRTLHATRALMTGEPAECAAAFGEAPCG